MVELTSKLDAMLDALKQKEFSLKQADIEQKQRQALDIKLDQPTILDKVTPSLQTFYKDLSDASYVHATTVIGSELQELQNAVANKDKFLSKEDITHIADTVKKIEADYNEQLDSSFITPDAKMKLQGLYNDKLNSINNMIIKNVKDSKVASANMFLNPKANQMSFTDYMKVEKGMRYNLSSLLGVDKYAEKASIFAVAKLDEYQKNPNHTVEEKVNALDIAVGNGYISRDNYELRLSNLASSELIDKLTLDRARSSNKAPKLYSEVKDYYGMTLPDLEKNILDLKNKENPTIGDETKLKAVEHLRDLRFQAVAKNGLDPLVTGDFVHTTPLPTGDEIAKNMLAQNIVNGNGYIVPFSTLQEKTYQTNIPSMIAEVEKAQNILRTQGKLDEINNGVLTSGNENQRALWFLTQRKQNGQLDKAEISDQDISDYYVLRDNRQMKDAITKFTKDIIANSEGAISSSFMRDINLYPSFKDTVGIYLMKNGLVPRTAGEAQELRENFESMYTRVGGHFIFGGDENVMKKIFTTTAIALTKDVKLPVAIPSKGDDLGQIESIGIFPIRGYPTKTFKSQEYETIYSWSHPFGVSTPMTVAGKIEQLPSGTYIYRTAIGKNYFFDKNGNMLK